MHLCLMRRSGPAQPELGATLHNLVCGAAEQGGRVIDSLAGRDFEPQIIIVLLRPRLAFVMSYISTKRCACPSMELIFHRGEKEKARREARLVGVMLTGCLSALTAIRRLDCHGSAPASAHRHQIR
jgi:hypothetical protein